VHGSPQSRQLGTCASCVAIVLTLSEPIVTGDTAIVSATALYEMGRGMRGYETIRFTLVRRGDSWQVHKSEQLGVT